MKMKAAGLHSTPGKLAVEEVDIAEPGPNEVRVKIAAIRSITSARSDWDSAPCYQRRPNGGLDVPIRKIKLDGIDFCVYYFHLSHRQNR